jgi:hypothetical protein
MHVRRDAAVARFSVVIEAIRDMDEESVSTAVDRLSHRHRLLAPLALVAGAFVMLFDGLKMVVSNWRLTLVQVLPAMWIWVALFDIKFHVLKDKDFRIFTGPALVAAILLIVGITMACFFLNATFAFAITQRGSPDIRVAMRDAWARRRVVLAWGAGVGVLLAFAAVVVDRWGIRWFAVSMSIVVGIMMVCYVAVPSRLIGATKAHMTRRDKIAAAAVGGVVPAIVTTPGYLLGRIGLVMVGSQFLRIPGLVFMAVGLTLHAGAEGSVKAVKMSSKLLVARPNDAERAEAAAP